MNPTKKRLREIARYLQASIRTNSANICVSASRRVDALSLAEQDKVRLQNIVFEGLNARSHSKNSGCIEDLLKDKYYLYNDRTVSKQIIHLTRWGVPSINSLMLELESVQNAYESLKYSNGCISAITEPITLKGIEFGRFSINLPKDYLGTWIPHSDVSVTALDPNPPAENIQITHPHVSGGSMCTGNASESLGSALREFRMLDYFDIVSAVLNTFGTDPFASLEAWIGTKCIECGASYSYHEESQLVGAVCLRCNTEYCKRCVLRVCCTDDLSCPSCWQSAFQCAICNYKMCANCVTVCKMCNKILCDDRCNNCVYQYHHHPCNLKG